MNDVISLFDREILQEWAEEALGAKLADTAVSFFTANPHPLGSLTDEERAELSDFVEWVGDLEDRCYISAAPNRAERRRREREVRAEQKNRPPAIGSANLGGLTSTSRSGSGS